MLLHYAQKFCIAPTVQHVLDQKIQPCFRFLSILFFTVLATCGIKERNKSVPGTPYINPDFSVFVNNIQEIKNKILIKSIKIIKINQPQPGGQALLRKDEPSPRGEVCGGTVYFFAAAGRRAGGGGAAAG
ncbi:MAG: hypothetical protein RR091_11240, partial [Cloacibacillus sp.]